MAMHASPSTTSAPIFSRLPLDPRVALGRGGGRAAGQVEAPSLGDGMFGWKESLGAEERGRTPKASTSCQRFR